MLVREEQQHYLWLRCEIQSHATTDVSHRGLLQFSCEFACAENCSPPSQNGRQQGVLIHIMANGSSGASRMMTV